MNHFPLKLPGAELIRTMPRTAFFHQNFSKSLKHKQGNVFVSANNLQVQCICMKERKVCRTVKTSATGRPELKGYTNHASEEREEWLRQSLDVRVYFFCLVNKIQRGKTRKKPLETRQNRERGGKKVLEGGVGRGTPRDVQDKAKEDMNVHENLSFVILVTVCLETSVTEACSFLSTLTSILNYVRLRYLRSLND